MRRLAPVFFELMAVLVSLTVSPASSASDFIFCVEDRDVRPWRTADGRGLNFELLDMVAARLGVRFQYRGMPWKRCLDELKQNTVQGAMGASFRPKRLENGAYPGGAKADARKRLNFDRYVLLRRKGTPVDWDGKQLTGLDGSVGAQLGYSIVGDLKRLGVPVDDGAPGPLELAKKLAYGYVGAAAMLEGEARELFASNRSLATNLEVVERPLAEKPYFLMLSHELVRDQPAMAERIWNTIESVRESRAYRQLESAQIPRKLL